MANEPSLSTFASMTRWFSPQLLFVAAYRDIVAGIFGLFADQRGFQHVADPIPTDPELRKKFVCRHDYSSEAEEGAPFWVDFAADVGDGFDSTYSVAYLLAADKLYAEQSKATGGIRGIRGLHSSPELNHGRLLIFGGDEIYPWPTHEAYDLKTFKPYALALPEPPPDPQTGRPPPARRHVYAIPGNHDWYDGLNTFDDKFCRARAAGSADEGGMRFGDWETRQHRSSFAIKLPHNWWIWGADIQLHDLLDSGQINYFRTVAEQMGPQDRFILCTADPSWYALGTPEEQFARENLLSLISAPIRRTCSARCARAANGHATAAPPSSVKVVPFHQQFLPCFETEDSTVGDLLHCGISKEPLSAVGQQRRTKAPTAFAGCPLSSPKRPNLCDAAKRRNSVW